MRTLPALLALALGCSPPATTPDGARTPGTPGATPAAGPLKLTMVELTERYYADEFAADRDLDGKGVELMGRIGIGDGLYFDREAGDKDIIWKVFGKFNGVRIKTKDATALAKGQVVTLRGVYRKRAGDAWGVLSDAVPVR